MKHFTLIAIALLMTGHLAWSQCNPTIDLGGASVPLCSNDNTDYNLAIVATNPGLSAGTWAGWSGAGAGNATSAMFNPATEGPGVYNISWTVTVADGDCMAGEVANATIFVDSDNSFFFPTFSFTPPVGCIGMPSQILPIPTPATSSIPVFNYSIDTNNTSAPGATVDPNGLVNATGPGNVVVIMTETNACNTSLPTSITIPFGEFPDLVAIPAADTICDSTQTSILLTTNYANPGVVEFWLVEIVFSSANINSVGSILTPGPVGNPGTSVFLDGFVLHEMLDNTSDTAQTATYKFVPTRSDGNLCEGDTVAVVITVMPTPNIKITSNRKLDGAAHCSREPLDFSITSNTMGGGVTFDLVIEESEDPNFFPADLDDDQTFPIIIPGLVASAGDTLVVSDVATAFVINKTGTFDPGRVLLGLQNIHLTDFPFCDTADVPPVIDPDQFALIYPEPVLNDITDFDLCSGEKTTIDLTLKYPFTPSFNFFKGFPVKVTWEVQTSMNDGGIAGASNGQADIYDFFGNELSILDIDQTLTNLGNHWETATYSIVPVAAGFDGLLDTLPDCFGDTLTIVVTVNPDPVATPNPANPQVCTGGAFMSEMMSPTTPAIVGDLEYLVTAISAVPNLGQGTTVIPNVTVLQNGQFLSEVLNITADTSESVVYTIRPQLNSSRINPMDPTTATCFGAETNITVDVFPNPTATVTVMDSDTLCTGDTVIVTGIPIGANPFMHFWEIANPQPPGFTGTGTLDGGQNSTNASAEFIGDNPGRILLKYLAKDAHGCETDTVNLELEIKPLPDVHFVQNDTTICIEGGPVLLSGIPTDTAGTFGMAPGLTDFGDGTAEFDPVISGTGFFDIIYTYTDTCDCTNSDTLTIEVVICTPTVSIIDPCSCRENPPGSQGNATTLENGQFNETIQVVAQSGQMWYIADVIGLFKGSSPHPPSPLIPFTTGPAGDALVENPAGIFTLEGVHIDGLGYQIWVTNGTDTLFSSNTCFYPNPVIENLDGGYCININAVPLTGHANPSSGTGVFNIFDSNGFNVGPNAGSFNPGLLGLGTFTVEYTFDEDDSPVLPCQNCNPGCVQAIEQEVKVVNIPGSLTCNNLVNVTVSDQCMAIVHPDMILEGTYPSYDIFRVEVYDDGVNLHDTITVDQVGKILNVKIFDECVGNHCWGSIRVEDKLGPVFNCPDTLQIPCSQDIATIPPPEAFDNCDGVVTPVLVGETTQNFGCDNTDDIFLRVLRVWRATDSHGNAAANCNQVIEFIQLQLSDVVFPLNFDNIDQPVLDCADFDTDPAFTGYPTAQGFPLDDEKNCSFNVLYQDNVIQNCGGSFKILRKWTVLDCCIPSGPNNPLVHTQIIKVLDQTPPQITCSGDITIGVAGLNCESLGNLPAASITDDCSSFDVIVFTPNGIIPGNGGLLMGLDLGTYQVTYQATDDCGNVSSCVTNVTVADMVAPIAVCDEFTIVSLGSTGETFSLAENFDDGSYDNCSAVIFDAKRMDDPGDFGPLVGFSCDDVGTPVMVIMRVTDLFGNSNNCMVTVDVQSKNSPLIACPFSVTVDCRDDLEDLALTGEPSAGGNCDISSLLFSDNNQIDNLCGTGFVVRTWTVTDVIGDVASCAQVITVIDNDPFEATDIEWPLDTTIVGCQDTFELEPESLPSAPVNYSEPIFNNTSCGMDPIPSHDDDYFVVTDSACFKIVRTWTVIDWCVFIPNDPNSAGKFIHEQVIKVLDNEPPILTNCDDRTFLNFTDDCSPIEVDLSISLEDCAANAFLEITWQVDLNDDGIIDQFGPGMNTSNAYPLGTHRIIYSVDDKCGNTANCNFLFTIEDGKNPLISCAPLNVEIMPQAGFIELPVTSLLYFISDNCTDTSDLLVSYSSDVTDTLRVYDCDSIGIHDVEIWVTDEANNQDFCVTQLDIQDNMNVCDDTLVVVISGGVHTEGDFPVNLVDVSVNGNATVTTDEDGTFVFEDLPAGGDYTLVPEKELDLLNGVTTFDMAKISKHVLNIKKLDSSFKIIAADINNSGTVTTMDLVYLRRVILHIDDSFPNNSSWRFVDAGYDFPDPANPFLEEFPEFKNYNNLTQNELKANFVAIKVGDVNGSVNPNNFASTGDRDESSPFMVEVEDRLLLKGETVTLDFYAKNPSRLMGFQGTLEFNADILRFDRVAGHSITDYTNFGLTRSEEGLILVSWNDPGFDFNQKERSKPLFSLSFRVEENGRLSDVLSLNSGILKAEAYRQFDMRDEQTGFLLTYNDRTTGNKLELSQNYPNPFNDITIINFNIPTSGLVTLKILDYSGELIETISGSYKEGFNQVKVDFKDKQASGVLVCLMETQYGVLAKKMVRIR